MADELLLQIAVRGAPQPRGSKDAFPLYRSPRRDRRPVRRKGGRVTCKACGETDAPIIINVADTNPASDGWMDQVRRVALDHWRHAQPAGACALEVEYVFFVKRPEDQWGTGRNAHLLRDLAPAYPITRPDALKLARGPEDALTGIVWGDDGQTTDLIVRKRYALPTEHGDGQGVIIKVRRKEVQIARQLPMDDRVRRFPSADPDPESGQGTLIAA